MQANDRFDTEPRFGRLPPGERRAQIVRAATDLFWEKGFHGASMRDIGERVGMLKGSLYAHVSSKEEILLEIVSTTFRRLASALAVVTSEANDPESQVRVALHAHVAVVLEDPGAAHVFFHESRHLQGQPGAWVRDAQARYRTQWERIYREGVRAGAFRSDLDVEALALVTLSIGDWLDRLPAAGTGVSDRYCAILLSACRQSTPSLAGSTA